MEEEIQDWEFRQVQNFESVSFHIVGIALWEYTSILVTSKTRLRAVIGIHYPLHFYPPAPPHCHMVVILELIVIQRLAFDDVALLVIFKSFQ